jgi:hypothetical protein
MFYVKYIALDGRMSDELEGISHILIEVLSKEFTWRDCGKPQNLGIPMSWHPPNTNLQIYIYTNLFG